MSDAPDCDIARVFGERLAELTLTGPAFDREAISADCLARLAMDATLDELIGAGDTGDPRTFDPLDPR
jgi:hypothetical protein